MPNDLNVFDLTDGQREHLRKTAGRIHAFEMRSLSIVDDHGFQTTSNLGYHGPSVSSDQLRSPILPEACRRYLAPSNRACEATACPQPLYRKRPSSSALRSLISRSEAAVLALISVPPPSQTYHHTTARTDLYILPAASLVNSKEPSQSIWRLPHRVLLCSSPLSESLAEYY